MDDIDVKMIGAGISLASSFLKIFDNSSEKTVLKERIEFFKDVLVQVEKEMVNLKQENARLEESLQQAMKELMDKIESEEFVQYEDALFKKKADGTYHRAVFCPKCHSVMSSFAHGIPHFCRPCHQSTKITPDMLDEIISKLN